MRRSDDWAVRRLALVLGVAAVTVLGRGPTSVAATAAAVPPAAEITQLREGPGHDLTFGLCSICHSVEYIPSNAPAMNRAGWQKSIQKMREKFGAPITDQQAQQILDYLATNYSGKSG